MKKITFLFLFCSMFCSGKGYLELLCDAVVKGDLSKVQLYKDFFMSIKKTNPVNQVEIHYGVTPLQLAVRDKHVKILRYFLENGGDITQLSCTLRNALHYCGQYISTKKNPCLPLLFEHIENNFSQKELFALLEHRDIMGKRPADNCKNFSKYLIPMLKKKNWTQAYHVYCKQLANNNIFL